MTRFHSAGKAAGGEMTTDKLQCYNSSTFMLPGGNMEDVKREFRAAFGINLPNFAEEVSRCLQCLSPSVATPTPLPGGMLIYGSVWILALGLQVSTAVLATVMVLFYAELMLYCWEECRNCLQWCGAERKEVVKCPQRWADGRVKKGTVL